MHPSTYSLLSTFCSPPHPCVAPSLSMCTQPCFSVPFFGLARVSIRGVVAHWKGLSQQTLPLHACGPVVPLTVNMSLSYAMSIAMNVVQYFGRWLSIGWGNAHSCLLVLVFVESIRAFTGFILLRNLLRSRIRYSIDNAMFSSRTRASCR